MHSDAWYHFLKDFAGPFATVSAAIVVAYYQKIQSHIARNKLRLELREERLRCYRAIQELFQTVACFHGYDSTNETGKMFHKIKDLYTVLAEGTFVLSSRTESYIRECRKACEDLIMYIEIFEPKGDAPRTAFVEAAAAKTKKLHKLAERLDDEFRRDLRVEA